MQHDNMYIYIYNYIINIYLSLLHAIIMKLNENNNCENLNILWRNLVDGGLGQQSCYNGVEIYIKICELLISISYHQLTF